MGRLIDTDELKDKLYTENDNWNPVVTEKEIDETPTVFDVEAVIKEVQDIGTRFCTVSGCNCECECCDHGSIMKAVIDAVRKGGVKNE